MKNILVYSDLYNEFNHISNDDISKYNYIYVEDFSQLTKNLHESSSFLLIIDFSYFTNLPQKLDLSSTNVLLLVNKNDITLIPINSNYKSIFYITLPLETNVIEQKISVYIKIIEMRENNNILSYQSLMNDELMINANIGIAIAMNSINFFGDNDPNILMNKAFENIYSRNSSQIISIGLDKLTQPDDQLNEIDLFTKLSIGEISSYSIIKHIINPDSSVSLIKMHVNKLTVNNNRTAHVCVIQDITNTYKIESALMESERSKSVLLSHLPGLAYRCNYDKEWTMLFVSKGCHDLTGYYAESLLYNRDLSFNDLIAPEYHKLLWNEWERVLKNKIPFRYSYQIITAEGNRKWVYEMGEGIFDEDDNVIALEGIIIDIDNQKKLELENKHKSEYDQLTNLHNRSYLEQLLKKDLSTGFYKKKAIIGINLTSLQSRTPIFGYQYTQELMKTMTNSLKEIITTNHPLFITYENFLVLYVKKFSVKGDIIKLMELVQNKLSTILNKERVGCGLGAYIFEKDVADVDQILRNVLIATEKSLSNTSSSNSYVFYDISMKNQLLRENQIKQRFNMVVDTNNKNNRLYLVYQPILDLKSNKITEFEALSRFESPGLGKLSPLEFIPILESSKLIIPVGDIIIDEALDFIYEINRIYDNTISISINISVIQLLSENFVSKLISTIKLKKVNINNVILELTETVFYKDFCEVNSILTLLRSKGIKIVIDDFGTGFSSLSRESELNIDGLKIDKLFIDKISEHNQDKAITSDIISMSHKLNHLVTAEGVESLVQKIYLINNNCDKLQGFIFSKPLIKSDAINFLIEHNKKI